MPIASTDIKTYLSGGAANTNPNASLGGVISSTEWTGGTLHDLFDAVTGDENAAQESEYRCIYVKNTHASLTWLGVKVWISAETSGGANAAIGLDPAGVGNGSTTGVATTIANEDTAPSGVTFSTPTTKAAGLTIGDIGPGQAQAIWIRRTTTNSAALDNDSVTLTFEGDTQQ